MPPSDRRLTLATLTATTSLLALITPSPSIAQAAPRPGPLDSIEAEIARYRSYLERPSLCKRTDGRVYLARTRAPEALDLLLRDYARPPDEPEDQVKYLVASITMHFFGDSIPESRLTRLLQRHRKPIDAWLWFEALRKGPWAKDRERLFAIVDERRNDPFCRAAAVAAIIDGLSEWHVEADVAAWARARLTDLDARPPLERGLWLEGFASMLRQKHQHLRSDPGWTDLCRDVIRATFDSDETLRRTRVVVASRLATALDSQNLGFDSRHWLVELDRKITSRRVDTGETSSVGFAGIRTKGDRIVYVIDASDSMLRSVDGRPPGQTSTGPTTGGSAKKRPEKGVVPTAADLDWTRIHTRFDAAREFVRVSLQTLTEDQHFAVILFGDKAVPLDATGSLEKASPKRIRKVLDELWSIEILPATEDRPGGRLRGQTNLHGGLRHAFRMTGGGLTKKAEFADKKAMLDGCDTLFVLTDGTPTCDDWIEPDDPEPHDVAGDPEGGTTRKRSEGDRLIFPGPYGQAWAYDRRGYGFLLDDVARLDLLRRCEIHCVGIGEANRGLLEEIARIGNGRAIQIDERLAERDADGN